MRAVGVHKAGHLVPFRGVDILEFGEDGTVETVAAVIMDHGWGSMVQRVAFDERRIDAPATAG